MMKIVHGPSLLTPYDIYLFREGNHLRLQEKLGAHPYDFGDGPGVHFAVWAPNAQSVSVIGDFNGWNGTDYPLALRWDSSGIWEGFVPGVPPKTRYKYRIIPRFAHGILEKADPFAFRAETPPATASVVWNPVHEWRDDDWMALRASMDTLNAPWNVYELHLGSWRRPGDDPRRFLTYLELADQLPAYLREMGYTHVEFLPVMEHPFYGSWGYQTGSYFAPTSRYGAPEDLMVLIDALHASGIGVILDWVPSHFPTDAHGLARFDGTALYEHEDPRKGFHPDWHSAIFNYGRHEVRAFLLSSALYWLSTYHADALRVDAVASMLYLDYSRRPGEWIPNRYGGRENLEAIDFLRALNTSVYACIPGVQTFAEESTAWPGVTRPAHLGGLGFGMKWNMGWMHDILSYFSRDPIHRRWHQNDLTFGMLYAYSENFILSLSHDECVHGKGSLWGKMPGDRWQKAANLRALFGFQFAHPGKKLLFMGGEFGQEWEWNHDASLDWGQLQDPLHEGIRAWVRDLNRLYREEPAFWKHDFDPSGFEWIDCSDADASVVSLLRHSGSGKPLLFVGNFTPVPRMGYRIGVPEGGFWQEILNSDATCYGGSGMGNLGGASAESVPFHGRPFSLSLVLPPLSILFLRPEGLQ